MIRWIAKLIGPRPEYLESPTTPDGYLMHYLDGERGHVRIGARLTLLEEECLVVAAEGEAVSVIEPGFHVLDLDTLGDLAARRSWPADYRRQVDADLVFVSLVPRTHMPWRTAAPLTVRGPESAVSLEAAGSFDFAVDDPARFAVARLDRKQLDDLAVREAIEHRICNELARLVASGEWQPGDDGDTAGLARLLRPRIRQSLAAEGIGGFDLRIRKLGWQSADGSAPATPDVEPEPASPAAGNVVGLGTAAARVTPDSEGESDAGMDPLLSATMVDLDRELADLDAWSSLSRVTEPPPDDADIEDEQLPEDDDPTDDVAETEAPAAVATRLPENHYYIAIDDEQTGPFSAAEFEQALDEGSVQDDTLVWYPGLSEWVTAGELGELEPWLGRT